MYAKHIDKKCLKNISHKSIRSFFKNTAEWETKFHWQSCYARDFKRYLLNPSNKLCIKS